jgi:hypothetical protein
LIGLSYSLVLIWLDEIYEASPWAKWMDVGLFDVAAVPCVPLDISTSDSLFNRLFVGVVILGLWISIPIELTGWFEGSISKELSTFCRI